MGSIDYLKDVPQENFFRLADGRVIRNLEELYAVIRDSGDTVFYDHVTPERNDFASWIKECVKHHELSNKLLPLKDRQSFMNVISQELDLLKNPKLAETMKFFSDDYAIVKENSSAPSPSQAQNQQSDPVKPVQANNTYTAQQFFQQPSPDNIILDFEQVLTQLVQEIQEEMFFWQ